MERTEYDRCMRRLREYDRGIALAREAIKAMRLRFSEEAMAEILRLNPDADSLWITLKDGADGRKVLLALVHVFGRGKKAKSDDAKAHVNFSFHGYPVVLRDYEPPSCKKVRVKKLIPAQPETVMPAIPERYVDDYVMACTDAELKRLLDQGGEVVPLTETR